MNYPDFKQEWSGSRVDYDHVFYYQCVDLILEYVKECFGLATGVWGNAIDYWRRPTSALLTKFDLVASTDCQQADIVVLNGLAGNPYGHIGICDSQATDTVRILEQNATGSNDGLGRSAIGVYRDIPKSRIAGLLRPKPVTAPAPFPAPARSTIFLPAEARTWRLYYIGSGLRPNTSDQKAVLAPGQYPPGLTYKIEGWVGDYAVIITTQMYGRGVIWVKGTEAIIT